MIPRSYCSLLCQIKAKRTRLPSIRNTSKVLKLTNDPPNMVIVGSLVITRWGRYVNPGRSGTMPLTLTEVQSDIEAMYGAKDGRRGLDGTFMWFTEEVGEL